MTEVRSAETSLPRSVLHALRRAEIAPTGVLAAAHHYGRNPWWIVESDRGPAFVKQLRGHDIDRRLRGTVEFEEGPTLGSESGVTTPRLYHSDEEGVLVYEHVDTGGMLDLGERIRNASVAAEEMTPVGTFLASLHSSGGRPSYAKPFTPIAQTLDGLSLTAFVEATAGQLSVWRLLHADPALRAEVRQLAVSSASAKPVPGHGDLRLDQILASPASWVVCDWEEYCWIDPAWDLGSLVGDILSTALGGSQADFVANETRPSIEAEVTESFEQRIRYALPLASMLIASYQSAMGSNGADAEALRKRIAGFAGWHLIERMLAAGALSMSVSGLARGIGGVGRGILLDSAGFASMLDGSVVP